MPSDYHYRAGVQVDVYHIRRHSASRHPEGRLWDPQVYVIMQML